MRSQQVVCGPVNAHTRHGRNGPVTRKLAHVIRKDLAARGRGGEGKGGGQMVGGTVTGRSSRGKLGMGSRS